MTLHHVPGQCYCLVGFERRILSHYIRYQVIRVELYHISHHCHQPKRLINGLDKYDPEHSAHLPCPYQEQEPVHAYLVVYP